jgi:uncharacterized protein with HEPN domain
MWRDEKYLLDMLLAARDARQFTVCLTREAFEQSRLHQRAIVNALQTTGEAARRISEPTREAHPEIPWARIVGMRHRLVHDYSNIDLDIVWDVVQHDVPALVRAIEPLIPPDPTPDLGASR